MISLTPAGRARETGGPSEEDMAEALAHRSLSRAAISGAA